MVHNYSTAHIHTMYQVRVSGNPPHGGTFSSRILNLTNVLRWCTTTPPHIYIPCTRYVLPGSGNPPHEDVVERKKGGESALENMFPESPDVISWLPMSRQHRQGAVKHHAKHETKADRIEVKHRLGGYLKSLQQQHWYSMHFGTWPWNGVLRTHHLFTLSFFASMSATMIELAVKRTAWSSASLPSPSNFINPSSSSCRNQCIGVKPKADTEGGLYFVHRFPALVSLGFLLLSIRGI